MAAHLRIWAGKWSVYRSVRWRCRHGLSWTVVCNQEKVMTNAFAPQRCSLWATILDCRILIKLLRNPCSLPIFHEIAISKGLPHNIATQIGNMFPILLRHPVALIGIRQFLYLFPREPAFQQLQHIKVCPLPVLAVDRAHQALLYQPSSEILHKCIILLKSGSPFHKRNLPLNHLFSESCEQRKYGI